MIKISRSFLFGFVAVALCGPALAQGAMTGLTGALGDGGASGAAALGGLTRSDLKLNTSASDLSQAANAVSAASAGSALQVASGAGPDGISAAKLGTFAGTGGSANGDLFANALPSSNAFANALGAGSARGEGGGASISGVNAVAALGVEKSSLANALGGQSAVATQRIGQ